VNTIINLGYGW